MIQTVLSSFLFLCVYSCRNHAYSKDWLGCQSIVSKRLFENYPPFLKIDVILIIYMLLTSNMLDQVGFIFPQGRFIRKL